MNNYNKLRITKGGRYIKPVKVGTGRAYKRQDDIAVRVDLPPNDTVEFGTLEISDCGLPIRHNSGNLIIKKLIAHNFTADLINSVGNLTIDTLIVDIDGSKLSKADYTRYHVDALGQFFNRYRTNVGNVTINNIEAKVKGKLVQGMMLSENYNDYSNFTIGDGKVDIQIEYVYAFNAIQLRDSYINVGNNGIIIKNRKGTKFKTKDVVIKKYDEQNIITNNKSFKDINFI